MRRQLVRGAPVIITLDGDDESVTQPLDDGASDIQAHANDDANSEKDVGVTDECSTEDGGRGTMMESSEGQDSEEVGESSDGHRGARGRFKVVSKGERKGERRKHGGAGREGKVRRGKQQCERGRVGGGYSDAERGRCSSDEDADMSDSVEGEEERRGARREAQGMSVGTRRRKEGPKGNGKEKSVRKRAAVEYTKSGEGSEGSDEDGTMSNSISKRRKRGLGVRADQRCKMPRRVYSSSDEVGKRRAKGKGKQRCVRERGSKGYSESEGA